MPERNSTGRVKRWRDRRRAKNTQEVEARGVFLADDSLTPPEHEEDHPTYRLGCRYCDRRRFRTDHDYFIESCLWVPNIDGGEVVPFNMNPGQAKLSEAWRTMQARGEPVRIVCLKSRKQGISTWCQAKAYQFTSTRSYVNALIITDDKTKSRNILDLTKKFHMLDERKALGDRPLVEASNALELKFGNPDHRTRDDFQGLQSRIEITSAESGEPGRSGTYHFVHASEVAFWRDSGVWVATGNALMDAPGTEAIWESTANGPSGMFHDHYWRSKEGRTGWSTIFLSWLDDPRCQRKLSTQERQEWDWLTRDERDYAERWKLTLEQAKFRRVTLADPKMRRPDMTPEDVFDQEYPASDELAFKGSSKAFFLASSLEALKTSERGVRNPIFRGYIRNETSLEERTPANRSPIKPILTQGTFGPLRVWRNPDPDHEYIVGGDVAEGLRHGDNHCLAVLDRHTEEIAAIWKTNQASSRDCGQAAALLGWLYNTAEVAIELNAHGVAAIQELLRLMYPRLWHHRDVRKEGEKPSDRVGWITSEAIRPYMLSALAFAIQDKTVTLPHSELYSEASTFQNIDGKPQALPGKHDDEIMGTAIALQVHIHSGPPRALPEKPRERRPGEARLVPDWPETGKVPFTHSSEKLRRVERGKLWGE